MNYHILISTIGNGVNILLSSVNPDDGINFGGIWQDAPALFSTVLFGIAAFAAIDLLIIVGITLVRVVPGILSADEKKNKEAHDKLTQGMILTIKVVFFVYIAVDGVNFLLTGSGLTVKLINILEAIIQALIDLVTLGIAGPPQ